METLHQMEEKRIIQAESPTNLLKERRFKLQVTKIKSSF